MVQLLVFLEQITGTNPQKQPIFLYQRERGITFHEQDLNYKFAYHNPYAEFISWEAEINLYFLSFLNTETKQLKSFLMVYKDQFILHS